ncbi:thiamine pyrophosphate-dependent enzyme [Desulfovirgula thermocuniculi]|uniref:thiamine pyrophosphate-dependent enzyme n=1 Tax=Desulfovirgula thermocuniculi TaxID=348842 RepID=UPI000418F0A7|nr:thiamine pyrophosphate-dependent enzyme [Desulfovirgula thermocuniculi]
MSSTFAPPEALTKVPFHYCPGCTHGIIHRLVGEAIDRLSIRERTIGVASVGCSVLAYNYFNVDMQQAAHGRAPAVATGIKRVLPDRVVFTYQGDGDLASIGLAELVHAAARGERITVIFVNNANYGMTGGQMAPTTLLGQITTTTPSGRAVKEAGYPLRVVEMLATLEGPVYLARVSVHDPANVIRARRAIIKAFEVQLQDLGFALVEVLSICPTNWGKKPVEALSWLKEHMLPVFPLGEFRAVS